MSIDIMSWSRKRAYVKIHWKGTVGNNLKELFLWIIAVLIKRSWISSHLPWKIEVIVCGFQMMYLRRYYRAGPYAGGCRRTPLKRSAQN